MPLYAFLSDDGERVERFYPMAEAPPFGTQVEEDGVVYTRLPVTQQARTFPDLELVARQLHPWTPGAPRYNEHGEPCFRSRHEIKEFLKRSNGERPEGLSYDYHWNAELPK